MKNEHKRACDNREIGALGSFFGGGVGGGSAEGTGSVDALEFAEYGRRFDTLCETGPADPNAPISASTAACACLLTLFV